ncbi:MAG: stage V sporulation protein AE [Clostridiales bacterium]|nr:stage V sporulation protein AE [Clostridiales bacterium]
MDYLQAFVVGGLICVIGQILVDKTKMTSARILVLFVVVGCLLGGLGIYDKIVDFGHAGATVTLPGFGFNMAKGVMKEVDAVGFMGICTGGLKAAAGGSTAAMLFALLAAAVFNPKAKG